MNVIKVKQMLLKPRIERRKLSLFKRARKQIEQIISDIMRPIEKNNMKSN